MLCGIVATVLFTAYSVLGQTGVVPRLYNSYYTSILGNLVMFSTCWVASVLLPVRPRDLTSLTLWDRRPAPSLASSPANFTNV